jgi:uncharacterized membrane protein
MEHNQHDGAHHAHADAAVGEKGGNIMAIFSYLWILIIIPFLTDAKDDPFVKYHLKQGLALIIFDVIGWVVAVAIGWFPVIGWIIVWLWWIVSIVLVITGIVNVLNGKEKELPLIGKYARGFTF